MGLYTWWRKYDDSTSFGIASVAAIFFSFLPIWPGLFLVPAYLWEFFKKTEQTASELGVPLLTYRLATLSSYGPSYSFSFIFFISFAMAHVLGLINTQNQLGLATLALIWSIIALVLALTQWRYFKPKSQREIIELLKKKYPKMAAIKVEAGAETKPDLRNELLQMEDKILTKK